jgi:hypothetical protein
MIKHSRDKLRYEKPNKYLELSKYKEIKIKLDLALAK